MKKTAQVVVVLLLMLSSVACEGRRHAEWALDNYARPITCSRTEAVRSILRNDHALKEKCGIDRYTGFRARAQFINGAEPRYHKPLGGKVLVASIGNFMFADAALQIEKLIDLYHAQVILLNLGDNAGGRMEYGKEMYCLFTDGGEAYIRIQNKNGELTIETAKGPGDQGCPEGWGKYKEMPVVIYVNQRSASTAELVARALAPRAGVTTFGERTVGKNSMYLVDNVSDTLVIATTSGLFYDEEGVALNTSPFVPERLGTLDEAIAYAISLVE